MMDYEIEKKMFEIMHTEIQGVGDKAGIEKYRIERGIFVSWLKENGIEPETIKNNWLKEKIERLIKKAREDK